jgi:hypothetical protein
MGPSPQLLLPTKPPEFSAFNAIFASFVAGLGAFVFGYSLGFTSPGKIGPPIQRKSQLVVGLSTHFKVDRWQ